LYGETNLKKEGTSITNAGPRLVTLLKWLPS